MKALCLIFLTLGLVGLLAGPRAAAAAPTCATNMTAPVTTKVAGALSEVAIDAACRYAYATNSQMNVVEVMSMADGSQVAAIDVGRQPRTLDFSPDGARLYVGNQIGTISVIDVATRTVIREVPVPMTHFPLSLAVAANGLVLFNVGTTNSTGVNFMQMDPETFTVTERKDVGFISGGRLRASGDRSVVIMRESGITSAPVRRYISATNSFEAPRRLERESGGVAVDATGAVTLAGGWVLDSKFDVSGRLTVAVYDVAIDHGATVAYQSVFGGILVYDVATFMKRGVLPYDDTLAAALQSGATGPGNLALSADGTMLVMASRIGLTFIPTKNVMATASTRFTAFSSAQMNSLSFLRFYNSGTVPSTAVVALYDAATGRKLGAWTSPVIAPGASHQHWIAEIEAGVGVSDPKPDTYAIDVQSTGPGNIQHVLWRRTDGSITNLSTCDKGVGATALVLNNVHSSNLDYGYPSSVVVKNTGTAQSAVTLGVYDAFTGLRLGGYTGTVAAGSDVVLTVKAIETAARITARPDVNHYNILVESDFTGFLQHMVNNLQSGTITDMTTVCALQKP